mmetsp:Transcript_24484/g.38180  ORF Transcript_24484/g.38180 Transcript_24484/m.38180 type:complete len:167 (-) Transcript_24484:74-574(-)|eukprot:CAMPEP_0201522142 /NCGR_PEP_ID=MMETSP0161_2-20130828/16480_1 /ASSEMBLY_ACC=CAM_ASM_000251 /TAXON_ID=180227 /ORGANISM="Neoparamoeba aestuarina, Strain SoJaBio B1-5/56/2" /LENGTH=166 /DNA_ID=CAMNT_0047920907 /DNA_START=82 /DNA_END=582 /DNA_ORIENTATION=-
MAALLKEKVSSDIEALAALKVIHPWVPGRDNIRPTPEVIEAKKNFIVERVVQFQTEADYVWGDVFGLPVSINEGGSLFVERGHVSDDHRTFKPNLFPYQLPEGTEHWVMWYTTHTKQHTDDEITRHVSHELGELCEGDEFEFIWYENPKMTIQSIFHIQVFWRLRE